MSALRQRGEDREARHQDPCLAGRRRSPAPPSPRKRGRQAASTTAPRRCCRSSCRRSNKLRSKASWQTCPGQQRASRLDDGHVRCEGMWRQNPVFVMVLGMCPTLAVTVSAVNALSHGAGHHLRAGVPPCCAGLAAAQAGAAGGAHRHLHRHHRHLRHRRRLR
ncbi:MAG: hypothetical protein MZV65_48670 [Chromatiales bacterium]|nr:hypothetical protein [Chromatiales bacterium]